MPIPSVEDAMYLINVSLSEISSSISTLEMPGFDFHDEVVLRVIQGLASQEGFTKMDPACLVALAYQVAGAAEKESSIRAKKKWRKV